MAVILRPKRQTQKPALGARLNGGHPLARGLTAALLLNEGGGSVATDLVGADAAVGASQPWLPTGVSNTTNGTTGVSVPYRASMDAAASWTMMALCTPTATAGDQRSVYMHWDRVNLANNADIFIYLLANDSLQIDIPFVKAVATVTGYTSGVQQLITVTRNGSAWSVYRDGKLLASVTDASASHTYTGNPVFFGPGGPSHPNWIGVGHAAYYWNRALTQSEVQWLAVDPYAFVLPQSPRARLYLAPSTVSYPVSLADTVSISDSVTRTATDPRALSDTVAISDTPARVVHVGRGPTDTVPVSDTVSRTVADARPLADTVPITDALSRTAGDPRTLADSVPISDSIDRLVDAGRLLADTVPVSDVVLRQLADARALADLVAISDTLTVEVFGPSSPGRATGTVTRSNRAIVTVTYARRVTASTDRAARLSGRAQRVGSP